MTNIAIYCLLLIGGIGTFLIGMKILQSASEKLAAGPLKKMFAKTAGSRWLGAGIGGLGTCIIQSSSAMTVMIVGFVNAGAMTLFQAASYIIGANIGTTITAQIVALSNLPISEIIIASIFVGSIMVMIFKKDKIQTIGDFICGLGLLFLGIFVMRSNLDLIFSENNYISDLLSSIDNPFLLLFIGIAVTAIFQSSSAVTSILIALALAGVVVGGTGNGVFFVILGTNIGSCVTALISSIGSSTNGKRAAVIHLLFNCIGSLIFFIFLYFFRDFNDLTFKRIFSSPATQIAMFHTFFNVICALLFLPFVNVLVKVSTILVPDKKNDKNMNKELDNRLLNSPEIAVDRAYLYFKKMATISMDNLNMALISFLNRDSNKRQEILKNEKTVEEMSKNLVVYLIKINGDNLTDESKKRISRLHLNLADIVRLSEIADNISGYTQNIVDGNLTLSDAVYSDLMSMKEKLNEAYNLAMELDYKENLTKEKEAEKVEDEIDKLRSSLIAGHLERLNNGTCKAEVSGIFINLVGNLERAGDHLFFISQRSESNEG